MLKKYKSLRKVDEKEIIIEKSSFIGTAKAVADEEEALEFIREVKKRHYEATHNVYAYILGDDNNIQRFSDDGEPSGTAGVPVLEVLKKNDISAGSSWARVGWCAPTAKAHRRRLKHRRSFGARFTK